MRPPKKPALVAGIGVVGLVLVGWLTLRPSGNAGSASGGAAAKRSSHYAWLPWQVLSGSSGAKSAATFYHGPRVPVRVHVVDVQGRPIAGAEVEARGDQDEYEFAGLTDEEAEAWGRAKYGESGEPPAGDDVGDDWHPPPRVALEKGRTDRDGVVSIALKPDVNVVFWAADGAREGVSGTIYVAAAASSGDASATSKDTASAPQDVTIEIAETGALVGQVADDHGRPVAGAQLHLSAWTEGESEQEDFVAGSDTHALSTGADGHFRIPLRTSGAFDLEVHAKGLQPSLQQALQVLPGRETFVSVIMRPSASIEGRVVDARGAAVAGARILVQPVPPAPTLRPDGSEAPVVVSASDALADEDGRFLVEELAPGRFTVAATADGHRPAEAWDVEAGGAPLTLRLSDGGTIRGTVTVASDFLARGNAPERAPVPEGDVYVSSHGEQPMALASGVPADRVMQSPTGPMSPRGRYFASVMLDETGHGTFDVTGLPDGEYDLTVVIGAAVATVRSVRTWDGGSTDVAVDLPDHASAAVKGHVRTSGGEKLESGSAFLYGALPSGLSSAFGPDGSFSFASVPPGDYTLHAVGTLETDASGRARNVFAPARTIHVEGPLDVDLVALTTPNADVVADDWGASASGGGSATPKQGDDWRDTSDDGSGHVAAAGEPTDDWGASANADASSGSDSDDGWMPAISMEQISDAIVVTAAPPAADGHRLFGGDRVTSIDGRSTAGMESWQALELLYGRKGTMCEITANRPATNETIAVSLPRTRSPDEPTPGDW